jgi:hypothetical protein
MSKLKKRNTIQRRLSEAPYSVDYFSRKHDISPEQARELMRKMGRNRDELNAAAAKIFRK